MSDEIDRRLCRSCAAPLTRTFVDLGSTPLANSYMSAEDLDKPEPTYPLHARVCEQCFLVQLDPLASPTEIFSDYAYFSSYSDSWVEHARQYADATRQRFGLDETSQVIEVASNDGYLLRHFAAEGIRVLGIEPARNVVEVARAAGIPTEAEFFGVATARRLRAETIEADLLIGNNVLAHVPDLNDFVHGLAIMLAPEGVLTLEFPHLLRLIEEGQFDTMYHEHFSYFSLLSSTVVLNAHGLRVFDVEQLPTHGGSLRVFACLNDARHRTMPAVERLQAAESAAGIDRLETYSGFGKSVEQTRQSLLNFLEQVKASGQTVVAYGAAAKGNTLLNCSGVGQQHVAYVVDRSPHKQGRYLPGSHLAILPPEEIKRTRPDFILVLAWNLLDEIMGQLGYVRDWGCRFVVPTPVVQVIE